MKRHDAEYFECVDCQTLQIPNPFWLEEAYAKESEPGGGDGDTGRFRRNYSYFLYFVALHLGGLFPEKLRVLDYGGGYGLLNRMLLDAGYDAWQSDLHIANPLFAAERNLSDPSKIKEGTFDVLLSLEVFEHLVKPLETMESLVRVLKPTGSLLISTGIYSPGERNQDWEYLSPEGGQHVTFWSQKALRVVAKRFGFQSLGYFPGPGGLIIFSRFPESDLSLVMNQAHTLLRHPSFCMEATKAWDFRHAGVVSEKPGGMLL